MVAWRRIDSKVKCACINMQNILLETALSNLFPGSGFGAFWASGLLSALERACLSSVVKRGLHLTLFSYDSIANIPDGIAPGDAETIVPRAMINRIIYNGKPDLAHFSDLFRYEMIARRDLVWLDSDILMVGQVADLPYTDLIVREEQGGINGAVLYFGSDEIKEDVIRAIAQKFDKELRWGETGPGIINSVAKRMSVPPSLYPPGLFYPIEHYDIWKVLLPSHREECEEKCKQAVTLHLFNNILTTMAYWKELAPPKGSYLYQQLEKQELLNFFKDTYPQKIMQGMIDNFKFRQNGKQLGIKTLLRQLVPSIGRTISHYRK